MHKKKKEPGRRKGPGPSDAEEPPSDAALSPEPPGDEEPRAEDLAEIEQEEQAGPDEPADDLPAGDSARMYLKEIGRIPRLDRDGEPGWPGRYAPGNWPGSCWAACPPTRTPCPWKRWKSWPGQGSAPKAKWRRPTCAS